MKELKRRFKELGISQREVADFIGMSQPLVSMILNGVVKANDKTERKLHKLSNLCCEVDGYVQGKLTRR